MGTLVYTRRKQSGNAHTERQSSVERIKVISLDQQEMRSLEKRG